LELGNMTRVQEFVLLGLSTRLDIRDVLFAVFLTLYLLTLLENTLIIYLIYSHTELHKPMYFFLGNLSCLEMCYVSVTMPSLLVGLWTGPYHISFTACMTQLFFFIVLICTECTLLASMAYDRYVAICRPLHYPLLMRPQVCLGLALSSWLGGLLVSVAKTTCIASLSLELGNMTRVQEFVLLGLSTRLSIRIVLFAVFLTVYLLTLLENTLIIYLIYSHTELHKPMYFFLGNLSCLEMCYVSVTMPSLLVGLGSSPCHVPFTACMTQLFLFIALISTKCSLLASMAYDRYVAICRPLHYPLLMRPQVCLGLALSSWLGGLLVSVAKTTCIASLSYCGPNVLNHFFCDVSPLLNLSCTHVALTELVDFISAIVIFCGSLLVALASYVAIGRAVLHMPSAVTRCKALSTCTSHL
ncbi:OLF5 protein, partial [Crocuta crocuta]